MPADAMTADTGVDDSLYAANGADKEGAAEDAPESVDAESAENPTALIPLSALGKGAKVGDTISLKVTKIEGEEAVVEIASNADTKSGSPMPADDELNSMDSMNQGMNKGY
jgi:hypothetical protein